MDYSPMTKYQTPKPCKVEHFSFYETLKFVNQITKKELNEMLLAPLVL